MRQDIEIHINTGDIVLLQTQPKKLYSFSWIENSDNLERYIYGEIIVPSEISENTIKQRGLYVKIPYMPCYKEFCVRIRREFSNGGYIYVRNPVNNSEWYVVQTGLYGSKLKNAYASELILISDSIFFIKLNKNIAEIYSGLNSDVSIVNANRQNANMLLKCVPTNNYRYPLSGVGLIRWANSNMVHTNLSKVLQSEFADDGITVRNAKYDFETGEIFLDLDAKNSNNGNV